MLKSSHTRWSRSDSATTAAPVSRSSKLLWRWRLERAYAAYRELSVPKYQYIQ